MCGVLCDPMISELLTTTLLYDTHNKREKHQKAFNIFVTVHCTHRALCSVSTSAAMIRTVPGTVGSAIAAAMV